MILENMAFTEAFNSEDLDTKEELNLLSILRDHSDLVVTDAAGTETGVLYLLDGVDSESLEADLTDSGLLGWLPPGLADFIKNGGTHLRVTYEVVL